MMKMSKEHDHLVMERDHMEKLYSSPNPIEKWYFNKRLNVSLGISEIMAKEKILDAGCGEGQFLSHLEKRYPAAQLWGADVTEVAIANAKKRTKATLSKQDITDLNLYKDNFFDVTYCLDVIEHVKKYRKSLGEFKRVTKKPGKIVLAFPNDAVNMVARTIMLKFPPRVPDHVNQFTPGRMQKLLGLRLMKMRTLPLNLPFLLALWCVCVFENK